jgi:hypothetical protein
MFDDNYQLSKNRTHADWQKKIPLQKKIGLFSLIACNERCLKKHLNQNFKLRIKEISL